MHGWVLKIFGTLLAKAMPSITRKITEELAHRFKPVEKYVFEDNNLDVQMRDIEKKCTDIGFTVTAMQTVLKDLDDQSHPPQDFDKRIDKLEEFEKQVRRKKAFKRKDG